MYRLKIGIKFFSNEVTHFNIKKKCKVLGNASLNYCQVAQNLHIAVIMVNLSLQLGDKKRNYHRTDSFGNTNLSHDPQNLILWQKLAELILFNSIILPKLCENMLDFFYNH